MIRLVMASLLATSAAGCAQISDKRLSDLSLERQVYVLVAQKRKTTCYVRVAEGIAYDEVCAKGNTIRYSPSVGKSVDVEPIPNYVLAVFDEHGKDIP